MINDRLTNILSRQFGIPHDKIGNLDHLVTDLGADSMDLLEIVIAIEQEFRVQIYEHEYEQAMTVDKVLHLIQSKRSS